MLKGFDVLPPKISDWKKRELSTVGFSSTSILKSGMYTGKQVQMAILVPKGVQGAGYVDEISYKFMNSSVHEYEILLQRKSKYTIIEAQKFRGSTILIVRWDGT
ncbi:MAG: ADP-ribosyltransferase [Christensenellaceae bacterium]